MSDKGSSSHRTVIIAAATNFAVAVVKAVLALFTGSASLWAEAAHSTADTGNQLLLFVGLRKSSKGKDRHHPFGHGQERYFWSFLAAIGIFVVGGLLSIGEGLRSLLSPEPVRSVWLGIAVLVVAALFEGYSWLTARRQLTGEARRRQRSLVQHLTRASDPSPTAVYLEDSAALIGIGLALTALILDALTGWRAWDGIAGVCIGVLLIVVAVLLARRNKSLLLEESVPDDVLHDLRAELHMDGAQTERLSAIYIGPGQILICAHLRLGPDLLNGPASELVDAVNTLRRHMLDLPLVVETEITVLAPTSADVRAR